MDGSGLRHAAARRHHAAVEARVLGEVHHLAVDDVYVALRAGGQMLESAYGNGVINRFNSADRANVQVGAAPGLEDVENREKREVSNFNKF